MCPGYMYQSQNAEFVVLGKLLNLFVSKFPHQ